MTVEQLKDLMLCLIEEGKGNSIICYKWNELDLDNLYIDDFVNIKEYMTRPDIARFSK